MKKVIIIGCPDSGKTTFAEKLRKYTGLPLFYLEHSLGTGQFLCNFEKCTY